jgi:hypothetical protein
MGRLKVTLFVHGPILTMASKEIFSGTKSGVIFFKNYMVIK